MSGIGNILAIITVLFVVAIFSKEIHTEYRKQECFEIANTRHLRSLKVAQARFVECMNNGTSRWTCERDRADDNFDALINRKMDRLECIEEWK